MKDPAFLFYSSDFLSGVQDLTMEERGQYITLLCLQHQKGRLTEKMVRLCHGICHGIISADVLAKFETDENGYLYNVRLEAEIEKRKQHSDKQRVRALDGWKKRKESVCHGNATAYATAMPLENENENIIDIDSYSNYRKIEFLKFPDSLRQRLESELMVNSPIVYTTDRANDQYKDFTEIIYTAITDEPWIMQLSRTHKPEKIRQRLTDFINYNLQSQNFRNAKYLSKSEFQQHFVNKYLK